MKFMRTRRRTFLAAILLVAFLHGVTASVAAADSLDELFNRAKKNYQAMLSISKKEGQIEAARKCIIEFQEILRQDPQGKVADRCAYLIGQSYHRIHDLNRSRDDLKFALEYYRMVVQKYPSSPIADDAQYLTGVLYLANDPARAHLEFSKVCTSFPQGDMQPKAARMVAGLEKQPGYNRGKERPDKVPASEAQADRGKTKSPPAASASATPAPVVHTSPNQLRNIQHWSVEDYTRVVLYTTAPTTYEEYTVPADPKTKHPGEISVDLKNCTVGSRTKTRLRIMDTFLREVRVTERGRGQIRVVLATEPVGAYRIFSMADPSRLIIDVRGKKPRPTAAATAAAAMTTASPPSVPGASAPSLSTASSASEPSSPQVQYQPPQLQRQEPRGKNPQGKNPRVPSLAQQLALDVKRIVLDPGHGGRDKGATSPNGIFEKDLTLVIARELKHILETETGCEVILTRNHDRYISLEERTAIANAQRADLFVSIHTNAHEDRSLYGTETYFLNLSKDKESARVAAFENATSTKRISDLETILHDLMLSSKLNESARLANEVQCNVVNRLRNAYNPIRDLGVKQAPFYVLLGAEMPSILIETAFITNEREECRLRDKTFQENLATSIAAGIESYIRHMKGFARAGDQS